MCPKLNTNGNFWFLKQNMYGRLSDNQSFYTKAGTQMLNFKMIKKR